MNSRGNAFVYILIAVVLLAGLTFALGRSSDSVDPTVEMNENQAKIDANTIFAYATDAQRAMLLLDQIGVDANSVDFMLPSKAGFNNAPTTEKLFHPDGGGLVYKPLPPQAAGKVAAAGEPALGYYVGRFNNIEWTPTAANDVIFVAFGIKKSVCEELNFRITGTTTIPQIQSSFHGRLVDVEHHSTGNSNLMKTNCAGCDEKPTLCATDGTERYAFYSVLVPQ